jgi:hypothetical protein
MDVPKVNAGVGPRRQPATVRTEFTGQRFIVIASDRLGERFGHIEQCQATVGKTN